MSFCYNIMCDLLNKYKISRTVLCIISARLGPGKRTYTRRWKCWCQRERKCDWSCFEVKFWKCKHHSGTDLSSCSSSRYSHACLLQWHRRRRWQKALYAGLHKKKLEFLWKFCICKVRGDRNDAFAMYIWHGVRWFPYALDSLPYILFVSPVPLSDHRNTSSSPVFSSFAFIKDTHINNIVIFLRLSGTCRNRQCQSMRSNCWADLYFRTKPLMDSILFQFEISFSA